MTEKLQIYKCEICGNIVEVLHSGKGELVCCGQKMKLLEEKAEDTGKEKHVPVLEIKDGVVLVKVGSIPHPMEENHYIEWVELIADDKIYRKHLKPGDKPEAEFKAVGEKFKTRVYCSVHSLWCSS